jgi:hypothetical protein
MLGKHFTAAEEARHHAGSAENLDFIARCQKAYDEGAGKQLSRRELNGIYAKHGLIEGWRADA